MVSESERGGLWIIPVAVDVPDGVWRREFRVLCELVEEFWVCVFHKYRKLREEFWKQCWETVSYSVCGVDDELSEKVVEFVEF